MTPKGNEGEREERIDATVNLNEERQKRGEDLKWVEKDRDMARKREKAARSISFQLPPSSPYAHERRIIFYSRRDSRRDIEWIGSFVNPDGLSGRGERYDFPKTDSSLSVCFLLPFFTGRHLGSQHYNCRLGFASQSRENPPAGCIIGRALRSLRSRLWSRRATAAAAAAKGSITFDIGENMDERTRAEKRDAIWMPFGSFAGRENRHTFPIRFFLSAKKIKEMGLYSSLTLFCMTALVGEKRRAVCMRKGIGKKKKKNKKRDPAGSYWTRIESSVACPLRVSALSFFILSVLPLFPYTVNLIDDFIQPA